MLGNRNQQLLVKASRIYSAANNVITEQPSGDTNIPNAGVWQKVFPTQISDNKSGIRRVKLTVTQEPANDNIRYTFGLDTTPLSAGAQGQTPIGFHIRKFQNGTNAWRTRFGGNGPQTGGIASLVGTSFEIERTSTEFIWRVNGAVVRTESVGTQGQLFFDLTWRINNAYATWLPYGVDIEVQG